MMLIVKTEQKRTWNLLESPKYHWGLLSLWFHSGQQNQVKSGKGGCAVPMWPSSLALPAHTCHHSCIWLGPSSVSRTVYMMCGHFDHGTLVINVLQLPCCCSWRLLPLDQALEVKSGGTMESVLWAWRLCSCGVHLMWPMVTPEDGFIDIVSLSLLACHLLPPARTWAREQAGLGLG